MCFLGISLFSLRALFSSFLAVLLSFHTFPFAHVPILGEGRTIKLHKVHFKSTLLKADTKGSDKTIII